MSFGWEENGFAWPPYVRHSNGNEKLYRAWGGHPGRKWGNKNLPGVCFSFDKAKSRRDAEMLYAVMEYQNPVWYLTEFSLPENLPYWVGKVHPGDPRAELGTVSGNQVLIERAYIRLIKEVCTTTLRNDLDGFAVFTGKVSEKSIFKLPAFCSFQDGYEF